MENKVKIVVIILLISIFSLVGIIKEVFKFINVKDIAYNKIYINSLKNNGIKTIFDKIDSDNDEELLKLKSNIEGIKSNIKKLSEKNDKNNCYMGYYIVNDSRNNDDLERDLYIHKSSEYYKSMKLFDNETKKEFSLFNSTFIMCNTLDLENKIRTCVPATKLDIADSAIINDYSIRKEFKRILKYLSNEVTIKSLLEEGEAVQSSRFRRSINSTNTRTHNVKRKETNNNNDKTNYDEYDYDFDWQDFEIGLEENCTIGMCNFSILYNYNKNIILYTPENIYCINKTKNTYNFNLQTSYDHGRWCENITFLTNISQIKSVENVTLYYEKYLTPNFRTRFSADDFKNISLSLVLYNVFIVSEIPYQKNIAKLIKKKIKIEENKKQKNVIDSGGIDYETHWEEFGELMRKSKGKTISINKETIENLRIDNIKELKDLGEKIIVKNKCTEEALLISEWGYINIYSNVIRKLPANERFRRGFEEVPPLKEEYSGKYKDKSFRDLFKAIYEEEYRVRISSDVNSLETILGCKHIPMILWAVRFSGPTNIEKYYNDKNYGTNYAIYEMIDLSKKDGGKGIFNYILCAERSLLIFGQIHSIDSAAEYVLTHFLNRHHGNNLNKNLELYTKFVLNIKYQQPWGALCYSFKLLKTLTTQRGYVEDSHIEFHESAYRLVKSIHPKVYECWGVRYDGGFIGSYFGQANDANSYVNGEHPIYKINNRFKNNNYNLKTHDGAPEMMVYDLLQKISSHMMMGDENECGEVYLPIGTYNLCTSYVETNWIIKYLVDDTYASYWKHWRHMKDIGSNMCRDKTFDLYWLPEGLKRSSVTPYCDINTVFKIGENVGTIRELTEHCSSYSPDYNNALIRIFKSYNIGEGLTLERCISSKCNEGKQECWLEIDRDLEIYPIKILEDPFKNNADNLIKKQVESYIISAVKISSLFLEDKEFIEEPIWTDERQCILENVKLNEKDEILLHILKSVFTKVRCGGHFQNQCNNPLTDV